MRALSLLVLVACSPAPEGYARSWPEARDACVPLDPEPFTLATVAEAPSDACAEVISGDLGDPDGWLVPSAALLLRFDFDPWFYDMIASNVDAVSFDPFTTDPDAAASYDSGTVTLHRDDDALTELIVLVHEAGHGRPGAHAHRTCQDGPDVGNAVCDRWRDGAIGAEVDLLDNARALDPDLDVETVIDFHDEIANSRLEL